MFCTHLGVVPGKVEAPTNLHSSESTPPAQDEGMQQQTWQYVHYLSCYSLVFSADTQRVCLMCVCVCGEMEGATGKMSTMGHCSMTSLSYI